MAPVAAHLAKQTFPAPLDLVLHSGKGLGAYFCPKLSENISLCGLEGAPTLLFCTRGKYVPSLPPSKNNIPAGEEVGLVSHCTEANKDRLQEGKNLAPIFNADTPPRSSHISRNTDCRMEKT